MSGIREIKIGGDGGEIHSVVEGEGEGAGKVKERVERGYTNKVYKIFIYDVSEKF